MNSLEQQRVKIRFAALKAENARLRVELEKGRPIAEAASQGGVKQSGQEPLGVQDGPRDADQPARR